MELPTAASYNIFACGRSPLQNMFNWANSSKRQFGHFLNKDLNLSHASQSGSSFV